MARVRPYPKKNNDRLADALYDLGEIRKSLAFMDDTKLNTDARRAIARLMRAVEEASDAAADGIESLAGGSLVRDRPSIRNPTFSDREGTG